MFYPVMKGVGGTFKMSHLRFSHFVGLLSIINDWSLTKYFVS